MSIDDYLKENLSRVLAFLCQILQTRSQGQLPLNCYLEAMGAAKNWCRLSNKTFVPNQEFIQLVFHLLERDKELFGKSINVIKKLLSESTFVKALEHNSEM